ncbi:MAG: hypothetical protein DRQ43_08490 [Gammaproteobacteria bacterium]|nr:MAG: hypothetical protein DRQ43_08490 [Gammaproteobacteria bacterium]
MSDKDKAMIEVLLKRMDKQRLPRLIDIREKLEQDQKLDSYDLEFLDEVLNDTRKNEHYVKNADDDLKTLFMKVVSLYKEIMEKALENEKKS